MPGTRALRRGGTMGGRFRWVLASVSAPALSSVSRARAAAGTCARSCTPPLRRGPRPTRRRGSRATGGPPDVVLILTDDQRPDTIGRMPTVRKQLRAKGIRFARTIAPTATCCPSRSSIATGLFAHETGVWGNTPPHGGWRAFYDNGNEDRTLAKALHDRGYRTGLFGKYANGYRAERARLPRRSRPAGLGHVPDVRDGDRLLLRLRPDRRQPAPVGVRRTTRPTSSAHVPPGSCGRPMPTSRCS